MELRHLRYFVAVAEDLSVRRAARRLHVSQPPLSRQIHDLEDELGTALFHRAKQKLTLTPAGEAFLVQAKQILSQAERATQIARAASRGEVGQLRVGLLRPLGGLFLPPAIRTFRQRFSVVDLSIVDLAPHEQIAALLNQEIDVGFVPLPIVEMNPALRFERLYKVDLLVALPPDHRLAKQRQLTLPTLAKEPFILLKRSSSLSLHDWILTLCREAGFEAQVNKLAESPSSILEMVSAGFGITLLPSLFLRFPSDVAFCPLPSNTPKIHLASTWRGDDDSPFVKAFLEILRTQIAKMR